MIVAIAALIVTTISVAVTALTQVGSYAWLPSLLVGTWVLLLNLVGVAVVRRAARNPIGYLLCMSAVSIALGVAAQSYAQFIYLFGHETLPLGPLAAWLSQWMTIPGFTVFAIVFLRFPNGALLSRRWTFVERLALFGVVGGSLALAVRPGALESIPALDNPYGIEGLRGLGDFAETVGGTIFAFVLLAAISSLILRFRHSAGVERQQLKWFVFPVAVLPVIVGLGQLADRWDTTEEAILTFLIVMLGLYLIPIGMGVAMLRYRLYDIDVLINRTLVYGGLTLFVGAFYLALVFVLQAVLPIETDSDVAVAASTLAAAALFRPLRTRIQGFIDRRFYRRRYDAGVTLNELAHRLRNEVDLTSLTADVMTVVRTTLNPAHASVWIRESNP
jgi:hypothetical protein